MSNSSPLPMEGNFKRMISNQRQGYAPDVSPNGLEFPMQAHLVIAQK